jgi:hypothetical protein
MPEPSPNTAAAAHGSPAADQPTAEPAGTEQPGAEQPADPAPLNRAARRGKARGGDAGAALERGFGGRARPAQGRRFNPIRRTG